MLIKRIYVKLGNLVTEFIFGTYVGLNNQWCEYIYIYVCKVVKD
jgi:hypothetical protein